MNIQRLLCLLLSVYIAGFVLLYLFNFKLLFVTSNSMQPTFSHGDLLIIAKKNEYKIQDIVSFRTETEILTNRISKIHTISVSDTAKKQYFQTVGDSKTVADSAFISQEQIIGKVIAVIPK